jgi:hypothetical protein
MRVVKEFELLGMRVSIFMWNEKYLAKYEAGPFEQTYKVPTYEVSNEDELIQTISNPEFVAKVISRFQAMGDEWFELFS